MAFLCGIGWAPPGLPLQATKCLGLAGPDIVFAVNLSLGLFPLLQFLLFLFMISAYQGLFA